MGSRPVKTGTTGVSPVGLADRRDACPTDHRQDACATGKSGRDAAPTVKNRVFRYHLGTGTAANMFWMMSSARVPSISASGRNISRWRSTTGAMALTSSGVR